MPESHIGKPSVAVLTSGGLDSAVLTVDLTREFSRVFPIYVRCGLLWEETELAAARAFLSAAEAPGLAPLTVLDEPIGDVYGAHWSTSGDGVPGAESPDEAVYLPGRNVLLTVKTAVWCRLRKIDFLALGSLGSNPFPDSTPEFFADLESVLARALNGAPGLIRPFGHLSKREVVVRGANLPLHLTFSCILPTQGKHCGTCNKCAERQKGFRLAGVPDRTEYASDLDPQDGRCGVPLAGPPSPGALPTCSA
ncbi:MAG: 7-cyano-7-deazaguanine synthase [Isosphaeraceae bacterium]